MAKHKTLEQKKLADIRRANFIYSLENVPPSIHLPSASKTVTVNAISTYEIVKQDIAKTFMLTLSIIVFQIILFFLLKKQIIVLPMVSY